MQKNNVLLPTGKKIFPLAGLLIFIVLLASCNKTTEYPGYTLIEKRFVEEVNAECYYFEHEKSGAKVLKIAADDPNKTFSITFKTITDSDCGTPHIIEHTVLEGSRNFPVKSPFDEMAKGSLRTFLNAFTSKDFTSYPAASLNTRDYFNLMHVYFDAVFNPLIYDRQEILQQEGWHYELLDADEPVVYRGVVYNEMKGAFSNPEQELYYQVNKHLFPDNCYRFSSGGYPEAIPDLTYEEFINYHRKYYHPSNSYILLYGDAELERELAFIDSAYLSAYDRAEMELEIPVHTPFESMREEVKPYPVSEGASTVDQTMFNLSFVTGDGSDMGLYMAMQVLADVLVNQESAPVRRALQDAGVGRDITSSVWNLKQQGFSMNVKNANPEDRNELKEVVFSTLGRVVEEGLDLEAVEGTINRLEFQLREGNTSDKGINYTFQVINNWMYTGYPFPWLEYEKTIAELRSKVSAGYLEQLIKDVLIENPHALLLALVPEPGLEKRNEQKTQEKLALYKAGLDAEEIASLITSTEALIARQEAKDSEEALATIPRLSLSDIEPEAKWYTASEKELGGSKLLHHDVFTNSILYADLFFDLRVLDQELLPYVSILNELLGKLDTEHYPYAELEKAMNIHTGGFSTRLEYFLDSRQDYLLIPKFSIKMKCMLDKTGKLTELAEEILLNTDFSDADRIREVLEQQLARVEAQVIGDGFNYAIMRLTSYLEPWGQFNEQTGGMEFYWFLKRVMGDYGNRAEEIRQNLEAITGALFSKGNLVAGIICSQPDLSDAESGLGAFLNRFPEGSARTGQWNLEPGKKNEGLMAASKVQYVAQGGNYEKMGYTYNGHLQVVNNIMSRDWLHQQIRVKGGAYGGFGSITRQGFMLFGSYRDPNLAETLETIAGTPEFISGFEVDSDELTRYIIGTIANLDRPQTPSGQGEIAFSNYFSNYTQTEGQKIRDEVISTKLEDIHAAAPLIRDVIAQQAYCVYGNEEKLKENSALFGSLKSIMEGNQ